MRLNKDYMKEWRKRNPEKVKEYRERHKHKNKILQAKWAKDNPERVRRIQLKHKLKAYNMDITEWDMIFEQQNYSCAACGSSSSGHQFWNLDHNHDTGEFRGILCNACNTALGMVEDSKERLLKLVKYLETNG